MKDAWASHLKQGCVAGLIGFATVAVWFAVLNVAAGRSPLFTSSLLGHVLLNDVVDPAAVSIAAVPILVYTAMHLAVFLIFGVLAAWLASLADRGFQLWYVSLFSVIFIGFHLFGAVQVFADPVRSLLSGAMVWGAGIAASLAMLLYLLWKHPRVRAAQTW